jgi:hypothetical protein
VPFFSVGGGGVAGAGVGVSSGACDRFSPSAVKWRRSLTVKGFFSSVMAFARRASPGEATFAASEMRSGRGKRLEHARSSAERGC